MKEFRLCIVVSSTIVWLLLGVIVYADEIVLMATHKRQIINTQTNNNKAIRFLANTPSANSVKNVTLPSGSSKEEIVQAIESLKTEGYLFVEQPVETILHEWPTDGTDPNDTLWTNAGMWGVKAVKTNRVWKDTRGDGIVVAVIDTGVQLNHEDVQGSLWINTNEVAGNSVDDDGNGYIDDINGYNFCANAAGSVAGGSVNDTHGHGTTIAGLIAGQGNNAKGIIGIAPNTKIMVIKANDCGENRGAYIASAIRYAINNGADVINGSWSFTSSNISEYRSEPTYDALVCARTPIALNITNGGSGYGVLSGPNGEPNYYWPTVSFSGGNGSGVSAQVSEIDGGVITEVTITNCGTGYTSAPTVTIHPATNGTITASGSGAIITSTLKKSVIPVFSSGNDNQNFITNNVFPAADPNNVISVGAIQNTSPYTRASFSNFGSTLDLVAPGQSLTSTKYHATLTNQYSSANDNGTSFATPLVVGAIALFRSYNENVSHSLESIKTRLHNSSFDIGIAGKDDYTGSGVLNIEALVYPIHISGTVRYYTHSAHTPKHI
ncbi:MAG: S8 family serine peptidase, partial [Alphaproteobacteria bacterium]|nr:S8 family serine peptidase [Alphaproteobacteria bacterium]